MRPRALNGPIRSKQLQHVLEGRRAAPRVLSTKHKSGGHEQGDWSLIKEILIEQFGDRGVLLQLNHELQN